MIALASWLFVAAKEEEVAIVGLRGCDSVVECELDELEGYCVQRRVSEYAADKGYLLLSHMWLVRRRIVPACVLKLRNAPSSAPEAGLKLAHDKAMQVLFVTGTNHPNHELSYLWEWAGDLITLDDISLF
jgi:hypothetical protein